VLQIYNLLGLITDAAHAQVAWLSKCVETNLERKKLQYPGYNNFVNALDCSCRGREIMKKYHSAKLRKIRVTKKLRDLWQHDPELEEILIDTCGSEKWL